MLNNSASVEVAQDDTMLMLVDAPNEREGRRCSMRRWHIVNTLDAVTMMVENPRCGYYDMESRMLDVATAV